MTLVCLYLRLYLCIYFNVYFFVVNHTLCDGGSVNAAVFFLFILKYVRTFILT